MKRSSVGPAAQIHRERSSDWLAPKPLMWCVGLFTVLLGFGILAAQAFAQEPDGERLLEQAGPILVSATEFRSMSAGDPDAAAREFFLDEALKKWRMEVAPYFEEQEDLWREWFRSNSLFMGNVSKLYGTIVFYDVWTDSLLLTGWTLRREGWSVRELYLLTGESFRGEKIEEPIYLAAWATSGKSLVESVWNLYHSTRETFDKLYRPQDVPCTLAAPVRERMMEQILELGVVKTRMEVRRDLLLDLDTLDDEEWGDPDLDRMCRQAITALRGGSRTDLAALDVAGQSKKVLDGIATLPPEMRENFQPFFWVRREERAVLALGDPSQPLLFVVVRMRYPDDAWEMDLLSLCHLEQRGDKVDHED